MGDSTREDAGHPLAAIAGHLRALGSPTRLELLRLLRTPRSVSEIRVRPSQPKGHGTASRALSRQGVTRHLQQLVDLGVVRLVEDARLPRGEGYVLDRERLERVLDELRALAQDPGAAQHFRCQDGKPSDASSGPLPASPGEETT